MSCSRLLPFPLLLTLAACIPELPPEEKAELSPEGTAAGQCTDDADNDEDGLFDCDDEGCAGSDACTAPAAPPDGLVVTIDPAAPVDDVDLACVIVTEAVDPNGDAVSYTYAWTVDGEDAERDTDTVPAAFTSVGQSWTCTVTPGDGTLTGTPATSSVTILQVEAAPPEGLSVAIDPAVPVDDVDLACVIVTEAVDPNGDAVTYAWAWTIDGEDAGLDLETIPAGLTSGGETWTCTVTPSDGTLTGTPASATVSIQRENAAPSAPVVAITPAAPTDDDALTCAVVTESVDPEGDAVTYAYAWTVDGVDAGVSVASVDAARTSAGETWTCSVIASDGSATGDAGTSSVSIAAAPTCGDGSVTHTASGVDFVTVCAQTFEMGCTPGAAPCESDETLHTVTLTNDYYVGRTEVTQGEFRAVIGYNPSSVTSCGDDCPVEYLSWHESAAYANAVSNAAGLASCYTCTGSGASVTCDTIGNPYTCEGYRLLTEAEWEAAARCGTDLTYAGSNTIGDVAWYDGNAGSRTHTVAGKLPNACGLYDMSGNVWEWENDWYGAYGGTATDPVGATSGPGRVYRGGSWGNPAGYARAARRGGSSPGVRDGFLGLRLARTAP